MNHLNSSPLLLKYIKAYELNPDSRVFAPLAEAYRKVGMIEKALLHLKEGIKKHPDYISGYICLASCYNDLDKPLLAYDTLKPFVEKNLDNILMLNLFAEICEKIQNMDEALETYKYLLFINPQRKIYQDKISQLGKSEKVFKNLDNPLTSQLSESLFKIQNLEITKNKVPRENIDIEHWTEINLSENKSEDYGKEIDITEPQWTIPSFNEEKQEQITKKNYSSTNVHFESGPVITHTLVELYIKQDHLEKAKNMLDKLLETNPNDERALKMMKIVIAKLHENSGGKELMSIFDKKVRTSFSKDNHKLLEKKYIHFLNLLHEREREVKSHL